MVTLLVNKNHLKGIFCIATGSATYMQLALNLGLSIKANSDIETILLHTNDALADLGWDIKTVDQRFGFAFDRKIAITVDEKGAKTPIEQAHYIKLSAYEIATGLGYDEVIVLDADTIMIPANSPERWFEELRDVDFTAYCGSYFDFNTGKQSKSGYTFWCEPMDVADVYWAKDKMPQINASFLYFKATEAAKKVFEAATDIWMNVAQSELKYEKHNGSRTEEMCLNIACAVNEIYPHKIPYYPLYFQYQHEEHSPAYAAHYYGALSMAGNIVHTADLLAYYNQLARYYRGVFGINDTFVFSNESKKPKDSPLEIEPIRRRTIWRRGELPNSDAGVFNPSGLVFDENLYTIFRKEKSMELYSHKYEHSTALPHLCTNGDEGVELQFALMPEGSRCEDFRLFQWGDNLACSYTIVTDMTNDTIYSKVALAIIYPNGAMPVLSYRETVKLPVKKCDSEKNWVFFVDDVGLWCIYSLSPYKIFFRAHAVDSEWQEHKVAQPNIKWWQHNRFICNSTNPILIGDSYLMFFHTKDAGIYSHGACLIDKETKEITHYTRNGIPIKTWGEGLQKNLIYVSGAVYLGKENIIRVYYGEADSHSCYNDYNATAFLNEIRRYKA